MNYTFVDCSYHRLLSRDTVFKLYWNVQAVYLLVIKIQEIYVCAAAMSKLCTSLLVNYRRNMGCTSPF